MTLTNKIGSGWRALAIALVLVAAGVPLASRAADHLDAPGLTSPAGLAAADINDLYVFEGADETNTVIAATVVPVAGTDSVFGSDVLYKLNIDTDADAVADIAYKVTFSDAGDGGAQFALVRRAEGAEAAAQDTSGSLVAFGRTDKALPVHNGGSFFVGPRSDPFFFDLGGFLGTVEGSGERMFNDGEESDFFAALDVLAMVLEVPDTMLGGSIGVWASTSVADGSGGYDQVDRLGRPAINTVVNSPGPVVGAPIEAKNLFNQASPDGDVATFTGAVIAALTAYSSLDTEGSYAMAQSAALAAVFLPDVIVYDTATPAVGPLNGRALADDVIDIELTIVTGGDPLGLFGDRDAVGGINTDGVGPHTDYLGAFPYLGVPHGVFSSPMPESQVNFQARLSTGNEVPPAAGVGTGLASLSADATAIDYVLVTNGVTDATEAHIHLGDPGANGPVVAFLFGPDPGSSVDGILARGSIEPTDLTAGTMEDLLDAMREGFAYVNVHTTATPSGVVRGQIEPLDLAMPSGSRFIDDETSVHEGNIEVIAAAGITLGSNPPANTEFGPAASVTRGQFAAMFDRWLNLPVTTMDFFIDDDGNIFESSINRLAARGITKGTNPPDNTRYSPNDMLTRGQIAAFLDRALDLQATTMDFFIDDDGNIFESSINRLAAAGIVQGTNPPDNTQYSPNNAVTRGQLASMIARAALWRAG